MKGWPDYTRVTGLVDNYDEYGQNYSVGGGDIAARLGSIKTYDMRGRVWWFDDFEAASLHWHTAGLGVGGAQRLISDHVWSGEQALGLQANAGGAPISRAWRLFALQRNIPLGLEVHFAQEQNFGIFEMLVTIDNGVDMVTASVRVNEAAGQLQYRNAAGGWSDSGVILGLQNDLLHFHPLKIAFDYNTNEWMRIMWDNQEVNLHREAMWVGLTGGVRYLHVRMENEGDLVNNAWVTLDDFIITVMEPD